MKPIHGFFITTDKRYNNTVDVDGKDLIILYKLSFLQL